MEMCISNDKWDIAVPQMISKVSNSKRNDINLTNEYILYTFKPSQILKMSQIYKTLNHLSLNIVHGKLRNGKQ